MAAGFAGFARMDIEAYPDPAPPAVVVITRNAGQGAEETERRIAVPIKVRSTSPSFPWCRRGSPTSNRRSRC